MWSGAGEVTASVKPESITLEDRPRVAGRVATRKSVVFEKPVAKGESCQFVLEVRCVAAEGHQPEPFVSTASSRRVDRLILRASFPLSRMPARVSHRLLDSDGGEVSHEMLECSDPLTGEFRIDVKYPRPFFEHRIEWEY